MGEQRWPFIEDWKRRGTGFDYHQTENFLRHLRDLLPSMTDDQEREVYRYMWRGNLNPTDVDYYMSERTIDADCARFVDEPVTVTGTLRTAYSLHRQNMASAFEARLFGGVVGNA